ncbi:hypothetical protein DQ238_08950 [Geodermatophilus sp. TF02-6]|uniref:hypothetical protein n=1 Tax=Geodermatophilus sp. TF02-6 TaxID=2250575 RepID=UPI000DE83412|nr:hypothetical protein [Geodermatophilus sp. TF02-6]RBY79767.1 hypothetical protein DQ238_08950 [Geodermatophilus sp. TF02-6]
MTRTGRLEPVHREEDGELVGYVSAQRRDDADVWVARALFGSVLRVFPGREEAAEFLRRLGLPLLAERWWYRPSEGTAERPTSLVEARLGAVTVRFGHDPRDTAVLSGAELDRLRLHEGTA